MGRVDNLGYASEEDATRAVVLEPTWEPEATQDQYQQQQQQQQQQLADGEVEISVSHKGSLKRFVQLTQAQYMEIQSGRQDRRGVSIEVEERGSQGIIAYSPDSSSSSDGFALDGYMMDRSLTMDSLVAAYQRLEQDRDEDNSYSSNEEAEEVMDEEEEEEEEEDDNDNEDDLKLEQEQEEGEEEMEGINEPASSLTIYTRTLPQRFRTATASTATVTTSLNPNDLSRRHWLYQKHHREIRLLKELGQGREPGKLETELEHLEDEMRQLAVMHNALPAPRTDEAPLEIEMVTPPPLTRKDKHKNRRRVVYGITPQDLYSVIQDSKHKPIIIDVRTLALFRMEHIRNARNIDEILEVQEDRTEEEIADAILQSLSILLGPKFCDYDDVDIYVYDHGAPDVSATYSKAVRLAMLLCERATQQSPINHIFLLEGGVAKFSALFPDECVSETDLLLRKDSASLRKKLPNKLYKKFVEKQAKALWKAKGCPPSQILPYLFIGCQRDATDLDELKRLGITHILIVGSELHPHFPNHGFVYKKLHIRDVVDEPIQESFAEACAFLDQVRKNESCRVLIHCYAGMSRSVTIAIAYLISLNYTLMAAYELVRERRTIISPNSGFLGALEAYERERLGISTKTFDKKGA
eukprot:CAMPEP_0184692768 /NCGR_PEP_ID=MMETSP0313-20130426/1100_1 /TAXON_ID=2792 /ORGANISM="Porphyridium aerugineum, Strain SAG 1380-2" /LENGTH=638 /DNA_ID=CAMNT_0027150617 /DNA_START=499 /DNA_END=2415 /DNA_ORIENTATION=-